MPEINKIKFIILFINKIQLMASNSNSSSSIDESSKTQLKEFSDLADIEENLDNHIDFMNAYCYG